MSHLCFILGESGTGKTCSLRNIDPKNALLIQPVRKPLPFRCAGWKEVREKGDGGSVYVSDDPTKIITAMSRTEADIIILDDFQYILLSIFMARRAERSYDKFNVIAGAGYDIVRAATELAENKRIYILCHTETDDFGYVRAKSIGKMLSEKIVVEGFIPMTLRTYVDSGRYYFMTHNSGQDTVKTPLGMYENNLIENDLAEVDKTICEYYGITSTKETEK